MDHLWGCSGSVLLNLIAFPMRWVVSTPMSHRFDAVRPIQPKYRYVARAMPRGEVMSTCSDVNMLTIEKYKRKPMMTMIRILTFRVWCSAFRIIRPMTTNIIIIIAWIIMYY